MSLFQFLKLIRWKNLFFVFYIFIIFEYVFFPAYAISHKLNSYQFYILLLAVLFIMAAGYIINDIFDIESDKVNHKTNLISKQISIEKAKRFYLVINSIGIFLGVFLCLKIGNPKFSFFFFGAPALLYYYSKKWKAKPLIGNIIVSSLVAFSSVILVLFDANFSQLQQEVKLVIILFFVFAFVINLIREICKDIEDVNGDHSLKMKTLPILIGRSRAKNVAMILTVILGVSIGYLVIQLTEFHKYTSLYLLLFVLSTLIYTFYKLRKATSKNHFKKINSYLKIIMFLGINTILILSIYSNVL